MASPGEEREGGWLTHLIVVSIKNTLGIDDLLVQLLGTSLQLVVVVHSKAVELQSVGENLVVAIWQLLTKGPVSSSCKIIIVALKLELLFNQSVMNFVIIIIIFTIITGKD